MTLNDLIKIIPKEFHDSLIEIDIPQLRSGYEGIYPLDSVQFDQYGLEPVKILLIVDVYK